MIMSIIIAIISGIILAFGYLVFEPDTIIQIITLLAGWGCLIFAGLCFIYWIFTTLKDNVGGNSSHSSSYHNSYSNRHSSSYSSSQSYNDSTSSNLKRPDESLEINIARSIDNHLPANTPSTNIRCRIYGKIKPDVVFSKGGFVSVPVVLAAKHCKIPAIIHESDITPGLANKLAIPSATKVCCNFPETMKYLPEGKAVLTGSPIRQELLNGNPSNAIKLCRFENTEKPVILIIGGSTGSRAINTAIRDLLPELLKRYNIIHLCGKGNLDETLKDTDGYAQFEYANKELADMFALAALVISRAGANAICELLALRKPNILIPLSAAASRGDQILNANSFRSSGYSYVLEEEAVTNTALLEAIDHVFSHKERYVEAMEKSNGTNSIAAIVSLIDDAAKKN